LAIVILTPVARGIAVARGMSIDDTVYVYSWFRFDGLALGSLAAIWIRSTYATPRNYYRFGSLLAGLAVVITIIGVPFGVLQTRSVAGTALRFTQAQLCFAAFLVVVLALRGT